MRPAFPELGINAADALTIAQTALGLLRQHIRSTDRIHGIVTKGGDAPNVVPAHTSARYLIRSETLDQLAELRPKVYRCFEAGGLATGATVEFKGGDKPYAEMNHDGDMAAFYRANSEALGRAVSESGRVGDAADGVDGYGECVAGDAVDSSDDRDQVIAGGESSAGVHGALCDGGCG
jgi:metal-dependent amidase/aminoacylase/carboxypeptidase family protein